MAFSAGWAVAMAAWRQSMALAQSGPASRRSARICKLIRPGQGTNVTNAAEQWRTDVIVIGAGPAGLAAANTAAQAGLKVLLIDENTRVGGQISRLPFRNGSGQDGPSSLEDLHRNIEFRGSTVCLGFTSPRCVALEASGKAVLATARAVVIATGSTERVYPVPGWTLPGVMTAGAGQTFLKGSRTFPYKRVVVAGSGPLLLATASQLAQAGVEVAAVVEATVPKASQWRSFTKIAAGGPILFQGASYLGRLLRSGIPIMAGHGVSAVEGDSRVTGVQLRRLNSQWQFSDEPGKSIACDAVLFNQGFTSTTDLVSQAGAEIVWNELMQTWEPVRDANFRTTIPGLYTAGDCAGIGGSQVSAAEGELVGQSLVAELTDQSVDSRRREQLHRRLRRLKTFREGMEEVFRVGAGVDTWTKPKTVVCRCQETTAGDVTSALKVGISSVSGVKLWTRAGMGNCQGRMCSHIIDSMLHGSLRPGAESPARAEPRPRFPIRPTSATVLGSLPELSPLEPSAVANTARQISEETRK